MSPEHEHESTPVDPRSEPGAKGAVASVPYWIIVTAVILVAVVVLYLAWVSFPPR